MSHTAAEAIGQARQIADLTDAVARYHRLRGRLETLGAIPLVWEVEMPLFGDAHLSIQLIP